MSTPQRPTKSDVVTDFRRSQILDAARETFARQGMTGTTVDGVARRAGVAKGTVYLYFKSKDEILRQILDEDVAELRHDTVPAIEADAPLEARIAAFIAGALSFFDRKRDFFEHVHFEMGPDVRRKAQQKLEVVFRAQVDAWTTAIDAARKRGVVGDIDGDTGASLIVAVASGLAKQRLRGWAAGPVDTVAATAAATLWKGLAAR